MSKEKHHHHLVNGLCVFKDCDFSVTKQPDNHIDEILDLIWGGALSVTTSKDFKDSRGDLDGSKYVNAKYNIQKTAKQQLDQYYADFYRNKIPEFARPGEHIPYTTINGVNYVKLDWLTAQFNSRGDNDEPKASNR